jgi:hypothetical protein
MHVPNVATFRLGGQVVPFPRPSATPELVKDAFERSVLPLALQALGGDALHASGVLGPAGVVAFCGDSGAGKSTMAYALSRRTYPVWADDAVAFEISEGGVFTHRLPFDIRLRPDAVAVFEHGSVSEKAQGRVAPLAAVVVLRRESTGTTSIRRLDGGLAFRVVLEQGYYYSPNDAQGVPRIVETYADLVTRVPVIDVCYQARWDHLGPLVDALEEIVRSPRAMSSAAEQAAEGVLQDSGAGRAGAAADRSLTGPSGSPGLDS